MESILNLIFNAENVRMLVTLAFVFEESHKPRLAVRMLVTLAFVCSGYVLMRSQMKEMSNSLNNRIDDLRHNDLAAINKRIDGVEASIRELKHNDFAHLNSTIEALTYALEKNGSLKHEDKEFVDSRLAY